MKILAGRHNGASPACILSAGFLAVALTSLSGCGGPSTGLPVYSGGSEVPSSDPAYPTALQIKYLGAGGVVLKRGADVLITAPFFSNPSIPRVAFGEIRSLPEQVDRFLGGPVNGLSGATAILVGHAHYDHLMDLPYIKTKYLPHTKIYGSKTMKNILAGDRTLTGSDIVSVEESAGTSEQPGTWWYASPRVRFMALKSEHAPIIFHLKFFEGTADQPLQQLPTRASGWVEGQTLAYLIDFLGSDGKTIDFRIHYQDAASNPPLGFPPIFPQVADQRRVDVAIVCMPGFNEVDDYPEGIIARLNPRFVTIIHWENFFSLLPDDPKDLKTVPTENAERFLARLEKVLPKDATYKLPAPGAWMRLAP
jgi:L-ascorbate metabolism protein UlaG (beta-lactamase superfamily)